MNDKIQVAKVDSNKIKPKQTCSLVQHAHIGGEVHMGLQVDLPTFDANDNVEYNAC